MMTNIFFYFKILHLISSKKMNNGSIVRGKIVEFGTNYQVKIHIKGGSILVYREDEIEKITKEYTDSKF